MDINKENEEIEFCFGTVVVNRKDISNVSCLFEKNIVKEEKLGSREFPEYKVKFFSLQNLKNFCSRIKK